MFQIGSSIDMIRNVHTTTETITHTTTETITIQLTLKQIMQYYYRS